MGYVEETGAAQHLRDARITPIYEGTNGIQAQDLVGRKLGRDGGEAVRELVAEMRATLAALADAGLAAIGDPLARGIDALADASRFLAAAEEAHAAAGSVPYLDLFGTVAAGWLMARMAQAAVPGAGDPSFLAAKRQTSLFYAEHFLARAPGLLAAIRGGATILAFDPDQL
jgi:hypothetical protein